MNLFTMPVSEIKGIGGKREELLNKIGINSVYDLLYYFPLRYRDRSEMRDIAALYDGCECCIKCRAVTKVRTMRIKSGLTISVCRVCDDSGEINVVRPLLIRIVRTLVTALHFIQHSQPS